MLKTIKSAIKRYNKEGEDDNYMDQIRQITPTLEDKSTKELDRIIKDLSKR